MISSRRMRVFLAEADYGACRYAAKPESVRAPEQRMRERFPGMRLATPKRLAKAGVGGRATDIPASANPSDAAIGVQSLLGGHPELIREAGSTGDVKAFGYLR